MTLFTSDVSSSSRASEGHTSTSSHNSSAIAYVNAQLVAHGFARPPGVGPAIEQLSTNDQDIMIKCLTGLLDQRVSDMSRTEDLTTRLRVLTYEHERLMALHKSAQDATAHAQREMEAAKAKQISATATLSELQTNHKQTVANLQRAQSALAFTRQTAQNEIKRKEKDMERVMEKWTKLANEQIALPRTCGMKCSNLITESTTGVVPRGDNLLESSLAQLCTDNDRLSAQAESFRVVLLALATGLDKLLRRASSSLLTPSASSSLDSSTSNVLRRKPLTEPAIFPSSDAPWRDEPIRAREVLHELLTSLGTVVDTTTARVMIDGSCNGDGLPSVEDRKTVEDLRRQVDTLTAELAESRKPTSEQNINPPVPADDVCASHASVSGLHSLREREKDLIAREAAFEKERKEFLQASMDLGQNQSALAAEKVQLDEERRAWAAEQAEQFSTTPKSESLLAKISGTRPPTFTKVLRTSPSTDSNATPSQPVPFDAISPASSVQSVDVVPSPPTKPNPLLVDSGRPSSSSLKVPETTFPSHLHPPQGAKRAPRGKSPVKASGHARIMKSPNKKRSAIPHASTSSNHSQSHRPTSLPAHRPAAASIEKPIVMMELDEEEEDGFVDEEEFDIGQSGMVSRGAGAGVGLMQGGAIPAPIFGHAQGKQRIPSVIEEDDEEDYAIEPPAARPQNVNPFDSMLAQSAKATETLGRINLSPERLNALVPLVKNTSSSPSSLPSTSAITLPPLAPSTPVSLRTAQARLKYNPYAPVVPSPLSRILRMAEDSPPLVPLHLTPDSVPHPLMLNLAGVGADEVLPEVIEEEDEEDEFEPMVFGQPTSLATAPPSPTASRPPPRSKRQPPPSPIRRFTAVEKGKGKVVLTNPSSSAAKENAFPLARPAAAPRSATSNSGATLVHTQNREALAKKISVGHKVVGGKGSMGVLPIAPNLARRSRTTGYGPGAGKPTSLRDEARMRNSMMGMSRGGKTVMG